MRYLDEQNREIKSGDILSNGSSHLLVIDGEKETDEELMVKKIGDTRNYTLPLSATLRAHPAYMIVGNSLDDPDLLKYY